jgi:hypothetical protein
MVVHRVWQGLGAGLNKSEMLAACTMLIQRRKCGCIAACAVSSGALDELSLLTCKLVGNVNAAADSQEVTIR